MQSIYAAVIIVQPKIEMVAKGFYSFFEPRFKPDIYRADV